MVCGVVFLSCGLLVLLLLLMLPLCFVVYKGIVDIDSVVVDCYCGDC